MQAKLELKGFYFQGPASLPCPPIHPSEDGDAGSVVPRFPTCERRSAELGTRMPTRSRRWTRPGMAESPPQPAQWVGSTVLRKVRELSGGFSRRRDDVIRNGSQRLMKTMVAHMLEICHPDLETFISGEIISSKPSTQ